MSGLSNDALKRISAQVEQLRRNYHDRMSRRADGADTYRADVGTAGSGNWGHQGRKGVRGGSAPGGGSHNRQTDKSGKYTSFSKREKALRKPHTASVQDLMEAGYDATVIDSKGTAWTRTGYSEYKSEDGRVKKISALSKSGPVSIVLPQSANPNTQKTQETETASKEKTEAAAKGKTEAAKPEEAGKAKEPSGKSMGSVKAFYDAEIDRAKSKADLDYVMYLAENAAAQVGSERAAAELKELKQKVEAKMKELPQPETPKQTTPQQKPPAQKQTQQTPKKTQSNLKRPAKDAGIPDRKKYYMEKMKELSTENELEAMLDEALEDMEGHGSSRELSDAYLELIQAAQKQLYGDW